MTLSSYVIAWIIYLLAAYGIIFFLRNLSNQWSKKHRYLLQVCVIIVLLTPYFSDPVQYKFAPAFLIIFFELLFGDKNIAVSALMPLLVLLLLSIGATIILLSIQKAREKLK